MNCYSNPRFLLFSWRSRRSFGRFWLHKTVSHKQTHCCCCLTLSNRVISFAEIRQTFKSCLRICRHFPCETLEIFDRVFCQSLWRNLWTCSKFSSLRPVKGRSSPSQSSTEVPQSLSGRNHSTVFVLPIGIVIETSFKHFIIFRRSFTAYGQNLPQTPCSFKSVIRELRFAVNT